jgi:hypothetical protein
MKKKHRESSQIPWPLPHYQHCPPWVVHLLWSINLHWHIIITQNPYFKFTLHILHSSIYILGQMYIDKDHHDSNLPSNFPTTPKNPLCCTYSSPLLSQLLTTTDLFTIFMALPFPECQAWKHTAHSILRLVSFI